MTMAALKCVFVFDINTWLAVLRVGVFGGLVRKRERLSAMSPSLYFLIIQRISVTFFLIQRTNHYRFYLSNG